MALLKDIKQDNGITTSYHRILYVEQWTNSHVSIAVQSYIDGSFRFHEEHPYSTAKTYETDYVENFTIQDAYAYLKTLPEFEGAENV